MAATAVSARSLPITTPSTSNRNKPKKQSKIEREALDVLSTVPGVSSKSALRTWLFIARTLRIEDPSFANIRTYIRNSQEHGFGIKVLNIIRIVRRNDYEFEHDEDKAAKFRMMLWHGTKSDCVAKILQSGIQNPPAKNQMFGTGIYFADRVSKSAQYCPNTQKPTAPVAETEGYLFLCDVLVGKMFNARKARNDATSPPSYVTKRGTEVQCDSVRCTGENVPKREGQVEIDGCVWPIGETVKNDKFQSFTVRYNEYIVYNPEHVKPKYLVKVQFKASRYNY